VANERKETNMRLTLKKKVLAGALALSALSGAGGWVAAIAVEHNSVDYLQQKAESLRFEQLRTHGDAYANCTPTDPLEYTAAQQDAFYADGWTIYEDMMYAPGCISDGSFK
jgi:hypothetical protein